MGESLRPPYAYTELARACSSAGRQNLFAVVAEYSLPRRSAGTDYFTNLQLVDPSTEGMQRPVEFLAFAPSEAQLPRVRKPGDIIRLHRVLSKHYKGKPQLMGKITATREGPPFAFCLFDSDVQGDKRPYQCSSANHWWDEREERILHALRTFVTASVAPTHLAPPSEYLRPIRDMRPGAFVDLVAQASELGSSSRGDIAVVGYGPALDDFPHWRAMFVWDGTDALPFPYRYDTRSGEEEGLSAEQVQLIRKLRPLPSPLFAEAPPAGAPVPLPPLGTILPVVIQGQEGLLGSVAPGVGSVIKLRNIGLRVVQGQLQGYFTRTSKWAPWQEEQGAVAAYLHRVEHNEVAGWAPPGPEELLAHSRHPSRPFTTLRQILADAPLGVPRKYRALVRVVDYSPQDPAQMCSSSAECGLESDAAPGYVYTLKLLLEDATGQLDAILWGQHALDFLPGLPAQDLSLDPQASQELLDRLQRLLGAGSEREGGPWIDVCLKAYDTPADPGQPPGHQRQYMIFDTIMT
ncbi:hypothetical protein N2152v2_007406 [Parachlorella kessleri]